MCHIILAWSLHRDVHRPVYFVKGEDQAAHGGAAMAISMSFRCAASKGRNRDPQPGKGLDTTHTVHVPVRVFANLQGSVHVQYCRVTPYCQEKIPPPHSSKHALSQTSVDAAATSDP